MKSTRFLALAALLGAAVPAAAQVQLNGAGATFPNIIYQVGSSPMEPWTSVPRTRR